MTPLGGPGPLVKLLGRGGAAAAIAGGALVAGLGAHAWRDNSRREHLGV